MAEIKTVLVLKNEHIAPFPFLDKEKNYIEHFLEAMLFFKKSEQEKKVGNFIGKRDSGHLEL